MKNQEVQFILCSLIGLLASGSDWLSNQTGLWSTASIVCFRNSSNLSKNLGQKKGENEVNEGEDGVTEGESGVNKDEDEVNQGEDEVNKDEDKVDYGEDGVNEGGSGVKESENGGENQCRWGE